MAIDFVHYHDTDLALHTWSGDFNLKALLNATRAYLLAPAEFEILDIRRLNLDSISSMDLFKLAEHLHAAYQSDRHVPGKTAIVYHEDLPLIYSSSQRLFHSFSIWAKEHQLPRDFALFPSMAEAIAWLGNRSIQDRHTEELTAKEQDCSPDQALSA
jgi:hypothetical protein